MPHASRPHLLTTLPTAVTLRPVEFTPVQHSLIRGVFHAAIGLVAATLLSLYPRLIFISALAAATVAFLCLEAARLRIPRFKQYFANWFTPLLRKEEENKLTGSSYFLIGSMITAILFPRDIALLAILFLSFGDPAASVAGAWKGHTRLWDKTLEGDIACFAACLLLGTLATMILKNPPLVVAMVGAVFATIFQSLPLRINDNITIPIGSAAGMLVTTMFI
jgi:glycerol-3-phosphate acyltransferase PlsY